MARGNDEFVVYSNQAELRLEGDDDNDLFVVRAFALAAVCDTERRRRRPTATSTTSTSRPIPTRSLYPVANLRPGGGQPARCTSAGNPGYDGEGGTRGYYRKDNNGDGVCNKADAHITGAQIFSPATQADPTMWEDDVIPLDADGVARPIIGLGFSTARPLDIRAGGGEDEVSYNVNAPVSVDGGTGFDKLVVLGTEFADDIVISVKGIFGAGLNVRYDNIEVVEVDGLEGDDEFFVLSTKFGVAYRVIGGLGSDTINVAGDVVEDIVTRELEGISGTIDHRSMAVLDKLYDGLPVDGLDYNLATPDLGLVIITETGPGTTVREGGLGSGPIPDIDSYIDPARRRPGRARPSTSRSRRRARHRRRRTTRSSTRSRSTRSPGCRATRSTTARPTRSGCAPGTAADVREPERLQALQVGQRRPRRREQPRARASPSRAAPAARGRPTRRCSSTPSTTRAPRVTASSSSSTRRSPTNPKFDQVQVRNVEVMVRDNDTPGIYVIQVAPGTSEEDQRSIVIEGGCFNPATDAKPVDNVDQSDLHRPAPEGLHRPHRRAPDPAPEGPGRPRRSASSSSSTRRASR